jgi:uncharacterized membrane protein YagU involved in acid resistance
MNRIYQSALAGFVATAPMTAVMWALDRGLRNRRERLPPEQITRNVAKKTRLDRRLGGRTKKAVSWLSHFAFGTASGAGYSILPRKLGVAPPVKGTAYGLLVWALSYLGWLPAARILPSATRQSSRRNLAMIAAHVVWGATLALLVERLRRSHRAG